MSVYKLKRKTGNNTTEDIQLDYSTAIANKPTIPDISNTVIHDDSSAVSESTLLDNYYTKTQSDSRFASLSSVTPSNWQTPTVNSTYISAGTIRYCEIGDIVIVKLMDVKFTSTAVNTMGGNNTTVIVSGLPSGAMGLFLLDSGSGTVRVGNRLLNSGNITSWWSTPEVNKEYYAEIVYVKNKGE